MRRFVLTAMIALRHAYWSCTCGVHKNKILKYPPFSHFMSNTTVNNVVDLVSTGIKKATTEYLKLVNYERELSWAPEYFLTVNIASELNKKLSSAYIFLEEAMGESREPPKGRPPVGYRPNKRYDIVVRTSNRSPMAAIEVKHRVYRVSERITEDIKRLSYAVGPKNDGKSVFKLGIFAFYTVFEQGGPRTKPPKEAINDIYDKLEEKFDDLRGDALLSSDLIDPKIYTQLRGMAWGGGCFILTAP